MSQQLKLCFTHYRPDSASHKTIDTASGEALDRIAESFGLWRHRPQFVASNRAYLERKGWETDADLRARIKETLDGYYEGISPHNE